MRVRMRAVARVLRNILPAFLLFALLVITLDWQSLWWDEGISLHLATASWSDVVADRAANIHPPLYFFALKLWVGLAGQTPFAARYLSVLAATLLPGAVSTFLRRRVDARTGRGAALLVALAPPFFIYGQEARAYAFLPLLALALLAQVWRVRKETRIKNQETRIAYQISRLTHHISRITSHVSRFTLYALRLAFIQTMFILTHYAGVVAVAWANLALLVQCLRARDRRVWRAWLLSVGLTALFALPWILAVFATGAAGLRGQAGLSNVLAEPLPGDYFLRLIGIFHAVGLPQAMADAVLWRPAVLAGVLLGAIVAYCVWRRMAYGFLRSVALPFPHALAFLLFTWLLPLTAAPLIWKLSPQAHPRYLQPFVLGGWLLAGVLVTSRRVPRWLRGLLLAAVLVMSLLGLRAYLTDPRYARSDVRAAATYIRGEAQPGDVVLLPHTDWSPAQYDLGVARPVMLSSPADDGAVATRVVPELVPGRRVYALDYARNALDPRGQVRGMLEATGYLATRRDFHGVFVQRFDIYATTRALDVASMLLPACVAETSLCLRAAAYQPGPEGGAALPVTLDWEGGPAPSRYAVGLRMYADQGALVAGADGLLLDAHGRPTELWGRGNVTTYHLIPLPPGLAPYPYRVEVGVYDVASPDVPLSLVPQHGTSRPALPLGIITPTLAPALDHSAYGLPDGPSGPSVDWGSGLQLAGAALDRTLLHPGQKVFVTLNWRWGKSLPDDVPLLRLIQDGRVLAEVPVLVDLPAMPEGRPVLEYLALTVPPDAAAGPATVYLSSGSRTVVLGEVALKVGEHTFVAPPVAYPLEARAGDVATLLGYDVVHGDALSPDMVVRSSVPFTLTLIWRAEEGVGSADLTVFTHLVDAEGGIVAQHDGKPATLTRPTTGWLPGEIIVDRHVLTWQQPYTGPAFLRTGLYDAVTGARVVWDHGLDAFDLPTPLQVE